MTNPLPLRLVAISLLLYTTVLAGSANSHTLLAGSIQTCRPQAYSDHGSRNPISFDYGDRTERNTLSPNFTAPISDYLNLCLSEFPTSTSNSQHTSEPIDYPRLEGGGNPYFGPLGLTGGGGGTGRR